MNLSLIINNTRYDTAVVGENPCEQCDLKRWCIKNEFDMVCGNLLKEEEAFIKSSKDFEL